MPKAFTICQNVLCQQPFSFYSRPDQADRKHCSRACDMLTRTQPMASRLWAKITRCSHEDICIYCCWPWIGSRDKYGHGYFNTGSNIIRTAHRVVWEVHHNRIMPPELLAAHECNYGWCCNPTHIYPATDQENVDDTIRAGRHAFGTRNGHAKLQDEDILSVFALYREGFSQREIGLKLHVSTGNIGHILHLDQWKHLIIEEKNDEIRSIAFRNLRQTLTKDDIPVIFSLAAQGKTQVEISQIYQVSQSTIWRILHQKVRKTSPISAPSS
jgi:hypothetical protein